MALLVLAAIRLLCVGGLGNSAMATAMGGCVGRGCEPGIACDLPAATGPATWSHPGNLPVAVTSDVERGRTPEQARATAVSSPLARLRDQCRSASAPGAQG